MSLFSNLLETYDKCSKATGIAVADDSGNVDDSKTFLPLFHTTFKSQLCVILDQNGNLIRIERDKKDKTIIIPCSEASISRSGSKKASHPICDQLAYLDKGIDKAKYDVYIKQLGTWKDSHIKLKAIYNFVTNNSLVKEIDKAHLFNESEKQHDGEVIAAEVAKIGIRFSVQIPGDLYPNVWEDPNIQDIWIDSQMRSTIDNSKYFDYASGNRIISIAKTHSKNINSVEANAKLISCNDSSGFTYRGRFSSQDDAILIDSLTSQKVHQTLKWLVKNYGYTTSSQVVVIWAVDSNVEEKIKPFLSSYELNNELFGEIDSIETATDIINEIDVQLDKNYAKMLSESLRGYGNANRIKTHSKKIVILVLDAATSGRLSVTFYQELFENEYIENIAKWHEESAWHLLDSTKVTNSNGKESYKAIRYIGCPSSDAIIESIYGKPRSRNDESFINLKKKVQQQLLECMFGNFAFPKNYIDMAAYRVSKPMSFTKDNGSLDEFNWKCALETACALTKKYIKQQKKEEISMELDEKRNDRDYLFGRLLALADKIEQQAMYEADKGNQRSTNALRLMNSFAVKPFSTWGVLWSQLNPYINQLNGAGYNVSKVNEVMSLFNPGDYENNKPLSPLYLLGYSHQTRAFYTKKND